MPILPLPAPARHPRHTPTSPAIPQAESSTRPAWLHRTTLWRCLLLSLLAMAVGLLLPRLPLTRAANVLQDHLAGLATPSLFWLRLYLARAPLLLLTALCALTRLSGMLTSLLLAIRGLSDGMTLGTLLTVTAIADGLPSPTRLLLSYLLWLLCDLTARLALTLLARRLANGRIWEADTATLSATLWRYLSLCLAALCLSALGTGLYTWLLL